MKTEWKRSSATPAPQDTYPGGLIVTQLHFIHCCLFKTFDHKSDPSYSSNSRATLAYVKRSQQRTISEKIWFSMHPRNFGSDKIVRTYVRTSTQRMWKVPRHILFVLQLGIGHPFYGQVTDVKKVIRWPVSHDSIAVSGIELMELTYLTSWPVFGF